MRKKITTVILVFWLFMTGWLVRFEAFPGFFAHTLDGYKAVFRDTPLVLDSWMKIKFLGDVVGYSQTRIDTQEEDSEQQYIVSSRTQMDLNVMGQRRRVITTLNAALDALYRLQSFRFALSSRGYAARVKGDRAEGNRFDVTFSTESGSQSLEVKIPDDVVIYSPMTEMALSKLRPGQQRVLRTFDPVSLSVLNLRVRATAREGIRVGEEEVETTKLVVDYNGLEIASWVDGSGQLVKQETPFGWVMEACSSEEALSATAHSKPHDILGALSVPCVGAIDAPRRSRELTLKLTGFPLEPSRLNTSRQSVLSQDGTEVVLRLTGASAPAEEAARIPEGAEWSEYLQATPFIQKDDPAVRRQAERIIAGARSPLDKARAIGSWVYENVTKNPTVSLPSTREVLRVMEGDCNEHTYLFVGLARAAGLPARIHVGLVYLDGAFFYHAWPAVYVGEWLEMDPTLGQHEVDATHITLLTGELQQQMQLAGMVGRLRTEVVESY